MIALLLACVPEPAGPPAAPDAPGPWAVGATTRTFVDERGEDMKIEVWYPAVPEAGDAPDPYEGIVFTLAAYRDAPPADGSWPLVAFSHGFGGIRTQSAFLTEHLASHGYVVVAMDHPRNTLFDLETAATAEVAMRRATDVRVSVDHLLGIADDPLAGLAHAPYAMVGHSFGAFTSLVVGGGVVDVEAGAAWCADHDAPGCGFVEGLAPGDAAQAVPDPRAVVTVPLAPGGWYAFSDLGSVRAPLVIGGDADDELAYDEEIRPSYEGLGRPKSMATLHRAGHWAFTDLCRVITVLTDCAGEADGWLDPAVVRDRTNTLVAAHVGAELRGDDYAEWLAPDAWDDDADLSWEVER